MVVIEDVTDGDADPPVVSDGKAESEDDAARKRANAPFAIGMAVYGVLTLIGGSLIGLAAYFSSGTGALASKVMHGLLVFTFSLGCSTLAMTGDRLRVGLAHSGARLLQGVMLLHYGTAAWESVTAVPFLMNGLMAVGTAGAMFAIYQLKGASLEDKKRG
eukprot:TRINITY_DN95467_c0_g1_i1.p1 TRINITY_DN95467_c0_g1~~TRINITY_DN95467_c0_g1_i1.p1  ORF type:complete len:178 (+),score=33.40 TRINITY_DN95467_c0_g1_i1:57-536(+)